MADLRQVLAGVGARWYLFGAQAAIFHGAARLTADVDITVDPGTRTAGELAMALGAAGFEPRVGDVAAFAEANRVLPLVHARTRIPVDVVLAGSGLEDLFFARAEQQPIGDVTVPVASAEDVVTMKVLGGRAKDLDDAAAILRAQRGTLDLHQVRETLRQIEQTYLERDVRELARVSDLVAFRHLLRLAALRTGQILKLSELGRDAKLNAAKVSRHLGLMEASFVFHRLGPYLANRASRLIKSPKVYVTDSGLASHLGGLSGEASLRDEPLRGALWETYAAQNLAATIEARWPRAALSFWHVQGRYEVDFVIEAGRRECLAIEVKSGSRWGDRELTGLRAFIDRTPRCRAAILAHAGDSAVRLADRLWAIPLATVLS